MSSGYPRYYTVNDRPVMLAQAPNGNVDCLALDMRTGNLVVDRSYFPYLTPGAGKDVDALSESAFISAVHEIRADLVYRWCQRMCSVPSGSLKDLEDVLAIPLEPPPLGANEIELEPDEVAIASITLRLPEAVIRRSSLDRRFGPPMVIPRLQDRFPNRYAYQVTAKGAPHGCLLYASTMPDQPGPEAWVMTLTVTLDRSR